jgi:lysophospholipase L1-like esterase
LAIFGDSILARMDRDVLAVPGVEYVILFIGVNDIGNGTGPASEGDGGPFALPQADTNEQTMIAAYRQVIARAHAHGVKVYGATIAPYGGAGYWNEDGEALRQAINAWIRAPGNFDAVIDFDAASRDPADPSVLASTVDSGDGLHPSIDGYRAMAEAVPFELLAD